MRITAYFYLGNGMYILCPQVLVDFLLQIWCNSDLVLRNLLGVLLLLEAGERLDHLEMVELAHEGQRAGFRRNLLVRTMLSATDVWMDEIQKINHFLR